VTTGGVSNSQQAYQATLIQQAATIAGSVQEQGTQVVAKAPPGANAFQVQAIGLEASVAGTLAASIRGLSTPPPAPLAAPGTNSYQVSAATQALSNVEGLLGSLGLGNHTNALA
jgi:hypothetical protein